MAEIVESDVIQGIKFARLRAHADARGRFFETFRTSWFPERSWGVVQTNRSDSHAGVLRGLHYHFKQVDYWYVPAGAICVGLADVRRDSPTFGARQTIEIGDSNQVGVFIPPGVAHGFLALTDATLTYLVDNFYDGDDELGVAWDDSNLAVDWGVEQPIMSDRDRENPLLCDIAQDVLPRLT